MVNSQRGARRAELAITSLISNKREWNTVIVLLNFLNSKNLEERNTSEKSEKIQAKSKKLDEDAIMCNTLRSDRRRLITKNCLFAYL